ncbi:hypothetical protein K438DRAFT_1827019 [Mycena galopus ATCC 62051]|nr:hypothetical protein K438DRAFT_1827019 [Mycena galopus ATCC 62051]
MPEAATKWNDLRLFIDGDQTMLSYHSHHCLPTGFLTYFDTSLFCIFVDPSPTPICTAASSCTGTESGPRSRLCTNRASTESSPRSCSRLRTTRAGVESSSRAGTESSPCSRPHTTRHARTRTRTSPQCSVRVQACTHYHGGARFICWY